MIQDQIRDVLAAHGRMAIDPREVDDQADLYNLGLTSHASVDVMLALEEEFDIEIPDDAAEHIQTVGDAVNFISERLGA